MDAPGRESWTEVIPHRPAVMLEGVDFFRPFYVLLEREQGLQRLRLVDLGSGTTQDVPFPEPAYSVFPAANAEFDTRKFRYSYESMVTPRSIFDYDLDAKTSELLKGPVLGGTTVRHTSLSASSRRLPLGAEVPISVVYRKDAPRDGSAPMLLGGMGPTGSRSP